MDVERLALLQQQVALGQGVGHQELQLARLVAAECQAGLVVALDQNFRAGKMPRKSFEFLQRRGQMRQPIARQGINSHRAWVRGFF